MTDKANFTKLAVGIPVTELKEYLYKNPYLWRLNTIRQSFKDSPHIDTECIFVRGPSEFTASEYQGSIDAQMFNIPEQLSDILKNTLSIADSVINAKELGYILIVNLLPGGEVFEHCDEGVYADYYDRYHLVVKSSDGNIFKVNGEEQIMREGDLWTFNHRAPHSVINYSPDDRIHIIFDVK